ncbi:hypothetical protein QTP70_033202 [Hemibagrus guttatus]|uniref:High mobility group AT-hook 2 n=1 Tax=Hemibagrus guttatus TaxID=175788 RepID=A0AAE0UT09_9TELE|nr:hypothetical protein QTP70_033202 [Hemibagrus guttatus]
MSARGEEAAEASGSREQPAPAAEPPKRGPGRPRKPQQEPTGEPVPKRPRGRPKGSKNKGPSKAAQKKAETTGEKRPRGRPRKWVLRWTGSSVPSGQAPQLAGKLSYVILLKSLDTKQMYSKGQRASHSKWSKKSLLRKRRRPRARPRRTNQPHHFTSTSSNCQLSSREKTALTTYR